ncbi:MAG: ArsR family transcriptional regulator [Bacteroidales bacterium]|nr:ArsR family transcriptional regulator [Bacteroidales bacterium]
MLDTLITNKTRLKLLLRFFLNSGSRSYLRGLEEEFDESTNSIRVELNRFEEAGLLLSNIEGNKKVYMANIGHPLYSDIHNILRKHLGLDRIVEQVVDKFGNVSRAYMVGDLAAGLDSPTIDLVLVGKNINLEFLEKYLRKAESLIKRDIHCAVLKENEEKSYLRDYPATLLIWEKNKSD